MGSGRGGAARVTVVVGAVGGVGTSTLAALVARRRASGGGRALLVDLDLARGGIDVLLGLERAAGVRWPDMAGVRGTLALEDLDPLLPRWRGVDVLSAGRAPGAGGAAGRAAVASVCAALAGSRRDVVVDLPVDAATSAGTAAAPGAAGFDDRAAEAPPWAELLRVARVLLVTGQDVLGVSAGVAAAGTLRQLGARCDGLVLRRRRGARVAPAEASAALGVPLIGVLPDDRSVAGSTDRGLGPLPGPWSALSRAVRRIDGGAS